MTVSFKNEKQQLALGDICMAPVLRTLRPKDYEFERSLGYMRQKSKQTEKGRKRRDCRCSQA